MTLRLVTNEIETHYETIGEDTYYVENPSDELPPPIPVEARMGWLSNLATAKADLKPQEMAVAIVEEKQPTNAWAKLPESTISTFLSQTRANLGQDIHARSNTAIEGYLSRRAAGIAYAPPYKFIYAKFDSACGGCNEDVSRGSIVCWYKSQKRVFCGNCEEFRAANVERMQNGLSDVRSWGN